MWVQLELKARQLFLDPIEGRITQGPADAIREFENLQRLLETGTMDHLTLAKLEVVY